MLIFLVCWQAISLPHYLLYNDFIPFYTFFLISRVCEVLEKYVYKAQHLDNFKGKKIVFCSTFQVPLWLLWNN